MLRRSAALMAPWRPALQPMKRRHAQRGRSEGTVRAQLPDRHRRWLAPCVPVAKIHVAPNPDARVRVTRSVPARFRGRIAGGLHPSHPKRDRTPIHDGSTVNRPEAVGVEFLLAFLDRLPDQRIASDDDRLV
jgi:hypothetical protein